MRKSTLSTASSFFVCAGLAAFTNGIQAKEAIFKTLSDFDKCVKETTYSPDECLSALQTYAKKNPKESFAIGKSARLQLKHWTALSFFEEGLGKAPTAAQCKDEDVALAVISGLGLPKDNAANAFAKRIFAGTCFSEIRQAVEKELASPGASAGYLANNACPIFLTKGIKVESCEPQKTVAAAAPAPVIEKLPSIDISKVKLGVIKVYTGSEGERVTVADVVNESGMYLLKVEGVRSDINGKTMVHKEKIYNTGAEYWTEIDGKRWITLNVRNGSYKRYTLNVPGLRDGLPVNYSDADSKAARAENLQK
jgi:hypothetical protein